MSRTAESARPRSISLKAFGIVALIAVLQFSGLAVMTAAQRDAAHVIDISGAQRMRSQRIAYLVLGAHLGNPVPGWRDELDRTIADVIDVRRQLAPRPELRSGAIDATGHTHLDRTFRPYLAAAQRLERDPHDAAAFEVIVRDRSSLLGLLDAAVRHRVAYFAEYNRRVVFGLVAGLIAQVALLAIVLWGLLLPAERAAETAMDDLEESQRQLRSLFSQNPDPVAIFDRAGGLVRGNRASRELLAVSEPDPNGETFVSHVEPEGKARAIAAFATVLAGASETLETNFVGSDGRAIAVDVSLFPWVVRGEIAGVIGVAKDVRALRAAEEQAREQGERVAELYRISAHHELTWEQQIDETMRLAATRLGFDFGIIAEVRDDVLIPVGAYGEPGVTLGERVPLQRALSRHAIGAGDVWVVDDLATSAYRDDVAALGRPWGAIAIVPIEIKGALYGSFVLGSSARRATTLRPADLDYVRIVAFLLASEVQRARQQHVLDSLAFHDHLTGLPNRKFLDRLLADVSASSATAGDRFAVLFLDIDLFKKINDTYGHATGDDVLRAVAARMKACVRAGDTVSRLGGDEFLVLQRIGGRDDAHALAQRLLATVSQPLEIGGISLELGISIGISVSGDDGRDAKTMMSRADAALYRAKAGGRNRAEFASDRHDAGQRRISIGELSA